jgi:transposase
MRKVYTSDITREQFAIIREDMERAKKETKPRTIDLYEIICAILYLLKNGCSWRNIPHDYPNWKIVYYYYTVWTKKDEENVSLLDKIQKKLNEMERSAAGRKETPSMLTVDSKSVQNTEYAEEKGYDGGKKLRA